MGHASFASIRAARAAARRTGTKRRGIETGAVFLLVSALGACSVGPDYQFSAQLTPPHWENASGRKAPRLYRWWTRLNDRVLDALIEEAVAGNLDVVRPIPAPRLAVAAGIPADVLLNRPDVRLAERHYVQYTVKVGQAEAARYPSASLTGSIATSAAKTGEGRRDRMGLLIRSRQQPIAFRLQKQRAFATMGFGAALPVALLRCVHFTTLATLTSNTVAAARIV